MAADGDLLKASTLWPGWFTDQQLAYEQAQHLSNALGASVNAGQLAQGWLDMNTPRPRQPRKRKRKHRVLVPGARAVVIPAPPQPQRSQPKKQPPRAYLTSAGVTAAILAALTSVLTALWVSAWALGWSSAVALIGTGSIREDAEALALLLAEGQERIGWMLETRLSRLERILLAALAGKISADELADQIAAVLASLTSALLVTQTEVTWASGAAAYAAYKQAGITYKRWQTRNDSRVCFPTGTPVATPAGDVPIESLKPGDLVITPQGQRRILATSARPYAGGATVIKAEGAAVAATDDHPFLTTSGWCKAGDLKPGDVLQSLDDQTLEVECVLHLTFTEPNDGPAQPREPGVAGDIPVCAQCVPVVTVGLQGDPEVREGEVDRPSADVEFLGEVDAETLECQAHPVLQYGLARETAVAAARAETPSFSAGWHNAELFAAVGAVNEGGGSAAFLGAVSPVEALRVGVGEPFAAPFAVHVDRGSGSARSGAGVVPVRGRCADSEVLAADGAILSDAPTVIPALSGAVDACLVPSLVARSGNPGIEHLPTAEAFAGMVDDRRGVITGPRAEMPGAVPSLRTHEDFTTMITSVTEGHGKPPGGGVVAGQLTVYDIEIDVEHVFYAGRMLVHNCGLCKANQDQGPIPLKQPFVSGALAPLQHPRCRCALLPAAPPKGQGNATANPPAQ